jgi:ribosomal protein S18 acetylase RimI-like enzyme
MKYFTIETLTPSRIDAVVALQSAYSALYPDAPVIPGEAYLSPAFEGGRNVLCAIDEGGTLAAYAPLYPVLMREPSDLPHTLWVEIKTHPGCERPNGIKDELFERLVGRAREVIKEYPGHPLHLTFQYFPSETGSIEYVLSKGCRHTESVFTMRRDLSKCIPVFTAPDGIEIRFWRMETEAEQRAYVQARNECFPEAPIELGDWQYFMQSPQWSVGTTLAAFQGDELAGNVALFWDEAENQRSGKKAGFTEHIFVRPGWRGKQIARSLICAGLAYLQQQDLTEAHLEVRAQNANALRLYADLGYEVRRESRFYVLIL